MKLACWNVLLTNARIDAFQDFVEFADADILAFQELSEDHIAALKSRPEYEIFLAEDCIEGRRPSFLGIAARVPVLTCHVRAQNSDRSLSASLAGRILRWRECLDTLSVSLDIGGTVVTVLNVHLSCAVPPRHRAAELREATADLPRSDAAIVCGDFNSFAKPWRNLLIGWAFGYGLSDYRLSDDDMIAELAGSHHLQPALNGQITLPSRRLSLDQVLYRGLRADHVTVLEDTYGSDHRPLVVEFNT